MSLSKLSKLPPEVLSCVLNNEAIPLSRRLHLRLLCNRWADIIEEGLKKETSLGIRDKAGVYSRIPKPDDLIIQSTDPTDEFTRPLSRLFTSLTQLTLNFRFETSWNAVPSLLAHLDTSNLTTVTLYGSLYSPGQIEAIAAALTGLPRLTSLTLVGYRISVYFLPHLKPALSRLEKFACFDNSGILSSSLSPQCTHLWLNSHVFQSFASPFLVELFSNLTHLHLVECNKATIWQSISQMHGLSCLALHFVALTFLNSSFLFHLAPFTRLTQVKLLGLKYSTLLALPSKKETPLSSIKRLTLDVDFGYSRVDYPALFSLISAWFPALLHLTFIIIIWPENIPDVRASLGKLSFSVEIVDRDSVDTLVADW